MARNRLKLDPADQEKLNMLAQAAQTFLQNYNSYMAGGTPVASTRAWNSLDPEYHEQQPTDDKMNLSILELQLSADSCSTIQFVAGE